MVRGPGTPEPLVRRKRRLPLAGHRPGCQIRAYLDRGASPVFPNSTQQGKLMDNIGLWTGIRPTQLALGFETVRAGCWERVQNGAFFDRRLCNARRFAGQAYLLVWLLAVLDRQIRNLPYIPFSQRSPPAGRRLEGA